MFGCKCPELASRVEHVYIRDTIVRIDTTLIVKSDTLITITPCNDTIIYVDKPIIKVITKIVNGVVTVTAICKEQHIRFAKDVAFRLVNKFTSEIREKKVKIIPFWIWIIIGLLAIPATYGTIKLVIKLL